MQFLGFRCDLYSSYLLLVKALMGRRWHTEVTRKKEVNFLKVFRTYSGHVRSVGRPTNRTWAS